MKAKTKRGYICTPNLNAGHICCCLVVERLPFQELCRQPAGEGCSLGPSVTLWWRGGPFWASGQPLDNNDIAQITPTRSNLLLAKIEVLWLGIRRALQENGVFDLSFWRAAARCRAIRAGFLQDHLLGEASGTSVAQQHRHRAAFLFPSLLLFLEAP